jgi:hypothetical protein
VRKPLVVALAVCALAAAGCVNKSPDRVKLVAHVNAVSLAVAKSSLVTTLSGTFDVELDVGDLASSEATITDPPSFELVQLSDQSSVRKLDAIPDDSFPITVHTGEHRVLHFTLSDGNTLAADEVSKACAGPVQIAASLQDSLTGDRPTAFESDAVTVSGCP